MSNVTSCVGLHGSGASGLGIAVSGSFRYPWIVDVPMYAEIVLPKVYQRGRTLSIAGDELQLPGAASFEGSSRVDVVLGAQLERRLQRVEAARCGSLQQNERCSEIRVTMH
jgi:hypothetical protein